MASCLNCGGLIGEPGKVYGYAGKWCYCPKDPATQYQRPDTYAVKLTRRETPENKILDLERKLEIAVKALEYYSDSKGFFTIGAQWAIRKLKG